MLKELQSMDTCCHISWDSRQDTANGILRGVFIEILLRTEILGFAVFGCYLDWSSSPFNKNHVPHVPLSVTTYPDLSTAWGQNKHVADIEARELAARQGTAGSLHERLDDEGRHETEWWNMKQRYKIKRIQKAHVKSPLNLLLNTSTWRLQRPPKYPMQMTLMLRIFGACGEMVGKTADRHCGACSSNIMQPWFPGRSNGPSRAANEHLLQ